MAQQPLVVDKIASKKCHVTSGHKETLSETWETMIHRWGIIFAGATVQNEAYILM